MNTQPCLFTAQSHYCKSKFFQIFENIFSEPDSIHRAPAGQYYYQYWLVVSINVVTIATLGDKVMFTAKPDFKSQKFIFYV
jgi:hypothetical protein